MDLWHSLTRVLPTELTRLFVVGILLRGQVELPDEASN